MSFFDDEEVLHDEGVCDPAFCRFCAYERPTAEEDETTGLQSLRTAGSCGTAIRQRKIQPQDDYRENGPLDYRFDFKKELDAFWAHENERGVEW